MPIDIGKKLFRDDGRGGRVEVLAIWSDQKVVLLKVIDCEGLWESNVCFTFDQLKESHYTRDTWERI